MKRKYQHKTTERKEAEAAASRKLADLPTTFPINDQIRSAVDHHDQIASDCEQRWGIGRLPGLVEPELADKFRAQQSRMNQAMMGGTTEQQNAAIRAMARAWQALDKRAQELGRSEVPSKWFEIETQRGLVAVCSSVEVAEKAQRSGRYKLAVHAQALSALIDDQPKLMDALSRSPPGTVTIRRKSTTGDKESPFNDRLPF